MRGVDPWRGVGYDPANPFIAFPAAAASMPNVAELVRAAVAAKACTARVTHGCGCSGRFVCRVREMEEVTLGECGACIEAQKVVIGTVAGTLAGAQ